MPESGKAFKSQCGTPMLGDGVAEGVARAATQMVVFTLETHKTHFQLFGKAPSMSGKALVDHIFRGLFASMISSGIVFGSYYKVYNHMVGMPGVVGLLAGPVSTLATSFIKIPMGNSMRLLQAGLANNLVDGSRRIVRAQGIGGLYSGYSLSVMEDMIEWDLRARLYETWKDAPLWNMIFAAGDRASAVQKGLLLGALTGMIASGITTPFDTIRTNVTYAAVGGGGSGSGSVLVAPRMLKIAGDIFAQGGIPGLFMGLRYRVASNAVKSGLFYAVMEVISASKREK